MKIKRQKTESMRPNKLNSRKQETRFLKIETAPTDPKNYFLRYEFWGVKLASFEATTLHQSKYLIFSENEKKTLLLFEKYVNNN